MAPRSASSVSEPEAATTKASPSPAVWAGSRAWASPSCADCAARWHASFDRAALVATTPMVVLVGSASKRTRWHRHPDLGRITAVAEGVDGHEGAHDQGLVADGRRAEASWSAWSRPAPSRPCTPCYPTLPSSTGPAAPATQAA